MTSLPLDGNAVAGLLHDVFGVELTATVGECAHCGRRGPVADTVAFVRGPGVVLRCRGCEGLLLVVVEVRGVRCVDVSGLDLHKSGARTMGTARGDE